MRYQDVVHRVGEGLPRELADRAATMLEQTLAELLPLLPRHARSSLLAALPGAPAGLAGPPEGPERSADRCRERLEDRVANTASVRRGEAVEAVQLVCASLRGALEPDVCAELVRGLPSELAALFAPRPTHRAPERVPTHGRHLSDGKPGGTHPLSESAPGSAHPLSAAHPLASQRESVASENPHADSKVSSSHGLTQEREHESLAEGRDRR